MRKRIVILGAGESGVGAAILAKKQGFDVFVSDFSEIKDKYKSLLVDNQIVYEENQHTNELILNADEIIKSPGISNKVPIIKLIIEKRIPIISEIEFAARYTTAKKICVTGSNGKTTTSMLIYHILQRAGMNVGLAGNVGNSFALQVALNNYDYYVIELSSFQLDDMFDFKAEVAILLNITPDHLDRYDYKFQNYINSKFRIIQNQTHDDYFIYCDDDEIIIKEFEKRNLEMQKLPFSLNKKYEKGAFMENNSLIINTKNTFSMFSEELALDGLHNQYNSMAASLAASLAGVRNEIIRECLKNFQNVEHRLEKHLTIRGIQFINDSKATNVNSVWYALDSMKTKVVLILGGVDKGNDYSILNDLVKQKVKAIVALGIDNYPIHKAFGSMIDVFDASSMNEAVLLAFRYADKGDTVLLSPACASFDLFRNYEDRGTQFKEAVRNL